MAQIFVQGQLKQVYSEVQSFYTMAPHLSFSDGINPLNAELNPIRHLLTLVGARHIVHVSRIRVNCTIIR